MGKVTPEKPQWCYGGQHIGMERKEQPKDLTCDQFRQWQSKNEMGL
jgi:hypothetical protein